ncbi:MAG: hypothetical protein IJO13_09525 [Lachnospiraceae bacterium]|nr:hypothetical protein [Lachnospiraceae bacterium]
MMKQIKKIVLTMALTFACAMPTFAMEKEALEAKCDQVIEIMASENKEMELCSQHIPLKEGETAREILHYFKYSYYYGDTNVVFGTTTCKKHGGANGCLVVQAIGSSRTAAEQHKEAIAKLQEMASMIDDNLSEKEKTDAIFALVDQNVSYAYATEEEARAAISKKRGGYCCYDGVDITPYAALFRGKSVCHGHAMLFHKLCQLKGISEQVAINDFHAFNIVTINGVQYLYDTVNGVKCGEDPAYCAQERPRFYTIGRLV